MAAQLVGRDRKGASSANSQEAAGLRVPQEAEWTVAGIREQQAGTPELALDRRLQPTRTKAKEGRRSSARDESLTTLWSTSKGNRESWRELGCSSGIATPKEDTRTGHLGSSGQLAIRTREIGSGPLRLRSTGLVRTIRWREWETSVCVCVSETRAGSSDPQSESGPLSTMFSD